MGVVVGRAEITFETEGAVGWLEWRKGGAWMYHFGSVVGWFVWT